MVLKFKDGIVICLAPEGGFMLLQLWQKTDESHVKGEPELTFVATHSGLVKAMKLC